MGTGLITVQIITEGGEMGVHYIVLCFLISCNFPMGGSMVGQFTAISQLYFLTVTRQNAKERGPGITRDKGA